MQATILERDEYKLKLDEALGRTASSLVAKHVAEAEAAQLREKLAALTARAAREPRAGPPAGRPAPPRG